MGAEKTTYETAGRRHLHRVMTMGDLTQEDVAHAVGTTQGAVSRWLDGTSRPGAAFRDLLEAVYGIARGSWRTREESRRLARVGARS